MKKTAMAVVLVGGLLAAQGAMAESQTVSIGYAHSKVDSAFNLDGVNLQYRYEWNSPWGLMGSFTWMQGDKTFHNGYSKDDAKGKYWSMMAGPTYRITDWVSLYGALGFANADVKENEKFYDGSHEHWSANSTSLAWGAGVMFNPTENLSLNVGYEGSTARFYDEDLSINGFNVGLGYRF